MRCRGLRRCIVFTRLRCRTEAVQFIPSCGISGQRFFRDGTKMITEALDPAFETLIDKDARLRSVGSGFVFTEGPVWHPKEEHLLFSDIPASPRRRYDGKTIVEQARPSNMGNGMTYDRDLNLLVCEHATSSLARFKGGA